MFPVSIGISTFEYIGFGTSLFFYSMLFSIAFAFGVLNFGIMIIRSIKNNEEEVTTKKGKKIYPRAGLIVGGLMSFAWSLPAASKVYIFGALALYTSISTIIAGLIFDSGLHAPKLSSHKGSNVVEIMGKMPKNCPRCHSIQEGNVKICTECGWEFIMI